MSVASNSGGASAQIQSLSRNVDELKAAISRARQVRLLMVVVLMIVLVVIVYMFMNLAKRVTSEPFVNELTTLAQKHVTDNQDKYQKEVQQFVDTSYPIVSGAFSDQATKDLPKFTEAINGQRETFVNNLRERMDEKISKKYQDLLAQHEEMIVAEFPELKDKETRDRVLANFQLVIEKLVKRNYGDQFDEESKKLIALWESFPAAEEPSEMDAKLEEKLLENVLHVAAGVMTTVQQNRNAAYEIPTATASLPADAAKQETPKKDLPAPAAVTEEPAAVTAEKPAEPAKDAPKDASGTASPTTPPTSTPPTPTPPADAPKN